MVARLYHAELSYELLPRQLYSPDSIQCDFYLFILLQESLATQNIEWRGSPCHRNLRCWLPEKGISQKKASKHQRIELMGDYIENILAYFQIFRFSFVRWVHRIGLFAACWAGSNNFKNYFHICLNYSKIHIHFSLEYAFFILIDTYLYYHICIIHFSWLLIWDFCTAGAKIYDK